MRRAYGEKSGRQLLTEPGSETCGNRIQDACARNPHVDMSDVGDESETAVVKRKTVESAAAVEASPLMFLPMCGTWKEPLQPGEVQAKSKCRG